MLPRAFHPFAWILLIAQVAGAAAPDALMWRRYEAPDFPRELAASPVRTGFATILFTFDEEGNLTDRLVTAATHPAFSAAVLDAAARWAIDPAGMRGPLRRESLRFEFERRGAVITTFQHEPAPTGPGLHREVATLALATCGEDELDAPLRAVVQALPGFPTDLPPTVTEGTATVSFVVDGTGRARVVSLQQTTAAEFGTAALNAARDWRFAPARREGRPVQVLVERTLRFRREPAGR